MYEYLPQGWADLHTLSPSTYNHTMWGVNILKHLKISLRHAPPCFMHELDCAVSIAYFCPLLSLLNKTDEKTKTPDFSF